MFTLLFTHFYRDVYIEIKFYFSNFINDTITLIVSNNHNFFLWLVATLNFYLFLLLKFVIISPVRE